MLELIDVCFEVENKKILKNINLKIDSDKFIAITGPNGSGKSTLSKIIMGIEKPTSGKIIFKGQDITKLTTYNADNPQTIIQELNAINERLKWEDIPV